MEFYRGKTALKCLACREEFVVPLAFADYADYRAGEGLPRLHRLSSAQLTQLETQLCTECLAKSRRWRWWPVAVMVVIAIATLVSLRGCS